MGEVAKLESIEVQPDELSAKVAELLKELADQKYDQPIDPERIEAVVSEDLLKEKIVDWLIEHSTFELVPEGSLTADEEDFEALAAGELAAEDIEIAKLSQESSAETSAVNDLVEEAEPTPTEQQSIQSTADLSVEVEAIAADVADADEPAASEAAEKARKTTKKPKAVTED